MTWNRSPWRKTLSGGIAVPDRNPPGTRDCCAMMCLGHVLVDCLGLREAVPRQPLPQCAVVLVVSTHGEVRDETVPSGMDHEAPREAERGAQHFDPFLQRLRTETASSAINE